MAEKELDEVGTEPIDLPDDGATDSPDREPPFVVGRVESELDSNEMTENDDDDEATEDDEEDEEDGEGS